MKADKPQRVYRSRTQRLSITFSILLFDVIIASGIARNTGRTSLVVFGVALIVLFSVVGLRAALAGIVVSPEGIHVRNVFSNSDFRWDEIERFEIDAEKGWFPRVCRIYTKNGRIKRAFGIQETNVAIRLPMEKRPAAKLINELNEMLADPEKRIDASETKASVSTAQRPSSV
jgi:hypothetical protein